MCGVNFKEAKNHQKNELQIDKIGWFAIFFYQKIAQNPPDFKFISVQQ